MSEPTDLPEPPPQPKITRSRLWILLTTPPLATILLNLALGAVYGRDAGGHILVVVPWLVLFLIIGCLVGSIKTFGRKYRGRSLVILSSFYFLGQLIVCLAFWFGSCVLVMR